MYLLFFLRSHLSHFLVHIKYILFGFFVEHDYIMVYIVSTGGLAFLITVAVACRRRFLMLDKSQIKTKQRRQRNMQNVQQRNNMINLQENENVYDIVEEQNMI